MTPAVTRPATPAAALLHRYGFCVLRGAAAPVRDRLEAAFEALLPDAPDRPGERLTRFHAIENDERMRAWSAMPALTALLDEVGATSVVASDVNVLVGDSYWHSDGFYADGLYLRAVVYGEPTDAGSGALRVIPGSHDPGAGWPGEPTRAVMQHEEYLGISGTEVPATVVDTEPDDVLVFHTNILHSAWNGVRRRQWAWNFTRPPRTAAERGAASRYVLNRFVSGSVRFS